MTYLSTVIPAYNEAKAIRAGKLHQVAAWLAAQPFASELLVVDDGSQDATAQLAGGTLSHVVSVPHTGRARAIIEGMKRACGEVILITDMDQATPITEASKLLKCLSNRADVAIGSRGFIRRGSPLGRYVSSWGHLLLRYLLLGMTLTDTQCGFKAVTRSAAFHILANIRHYLLDQHPPLREAHVNSGFDAEFLFVAQRLGYRIEEVPVVWHYQETPRVSLPRDAWLGVRELMSIAIAHFRGEYRPTDPTAP